MGAEVAVDQAGEAVEASLEGASEVAHLEEEALPVAGSLQRTKYKGEAPIANDAPIRSYSLWGLPLCPFGLLGAKPGLTHGSSSRLYSRPSFKAIAEHIVLVDLVAKVIHPSGKLSIAKEQSTSILPLQLDTH